MQLPDPKFPPLFTGHAVAADAQPFAEACRGARTGIYGAGDIMWARATDRAAIALVLEPDVALATACQMNALAHVAIAETLGHLCPPKVAVMSRWPGGVLVNGAACGTVRLAAPTTQADAVPTWLVVAVDLVMSVERLDEPGERPGETSLEEEGGLAGDGGPVTSTDFIEALATRLLAWLHTWQTDGFRPIHDHWLFRAEGRDEDISVDGVTGRVLGLDDTGCLLLKPRDLKPSDAGSVRVFSMLPHVQVPV